MKNKDTNWLKKKKGSEFQENMFNGRNFDKTLLDKS